MVLTKILDDLGYTNCQTNNVELLADEYDEYLYRLRLCDYLQPFRWLLLHIICKLYIVDAA
jgi:hypothetical protein